MKVITKKCLEIFRIIQNVLVYKASYKMFWFTKDNFHSMTYGCLQTSNYRVQMP